MCPYPVRVVRAHQERLPEGDVAGGESDHSFTGRVHGAGVENRYPAAHHVILISGGLQPDVFPGFDGTARERQPGLIHRLQRAQKVGLVTGVRAKAVRGRVFIRAVADRGEVGVEADLEPFFAIGAGFGQCGFG